MQAVSSRLENLHWAHLALCLSFNATIAPALRTLRKESILVAFILSSSSPCLVPKADTVSGKAQKSKNAKAPIIWPEKGKGDPCELESVVEIVKRREYEKEILHNGVWTTGFTDIDMTLNSLPLALQTDLGVNHGPGPRLATGRHTHKTDLSSTAKALKAALIGTAHQKQAGACNLTGSIVCEQNTRYLYGV